MLNRDKTNSDQQLQNSQCEGQYATIEENCEVPFPSSFRHRLADDNHEQQYSNIDQAMNTGNHANIIQSPG